MKLRGSTVVESERQPYLDLTEVRPRTRALRHILGVRVPGSNGLRRL